MYHNITFNLKNGELKYYRFNSSYDFLIKTSQKGHESQFARSRLPIPLHRLQMFLGDNIQLDDIFVDTIDFDLDSYWLMLEASDPKNVKNLIVKLLELYQVSEKDFLHWAGFLNELNLESIDECVAKKCIAAIRVPIQSNRLKIYARPFRYNSFAIDEATENILCNALGCEKSELKYQLYEMGGVSYDFSDERIVLFTQNDKIKEHR